MKNGQQVHIGNVKSQAWHKNVSSTCDKKSGFTPLNKLRKAFILRKDIKRYSQQQKLLCIQLSFSWYYQNLKVAEEYCLLGCKAV
jgi:hypothetical protein